MSELFAPALLMEHGRGRHSPFLFCGSQPLLALRQPACRRRGPLPGEGAPCSARLPSLLSAAGVSYLFTRRCRFSSRWGPRSVLFSSVAGAARGHTALHAAADTVGAAAAVDAFSSLFRRFTCPPVALFYLQCSQLRRQLGCSSKGVHSVLGDSRTLTLLPGAACSTSPGSAICSQALQSASSPLFLAVQIPLFITGSSFGSFQQLMVLGHGVGYRPHRQCDVWP